jgi:hypothetical protein
MKYFLIGLVCFLDPCLGISGICNKAEITRVVYTDMDAAVPGSPDPSVRRANFDYFVTQLDGAVSDTEKVRIFIRFPTKTEGMYGLLVSKVRGEDRLLDSLFTLALSKGDEDARSQLDQKTAFRMIGTFCDRRAGKFLVERMERASTKREKIFAMDALENMGDAAAWRDDYRDYVVRGAPNLDPTNASDFWVIERAIRLFGKVAKAGDQVYLDHFKKVSNPKIKDAIGSVSTGIEGNAAGDDKHE